MWLTGYKYVILLPALAPLLYYLLALYAARKFFHQNKRIGCDKAFAPPVSILKPIRGVDREAYDNFASMCGLDYPEYEILFAVADPRDPVIPVIEKLQEQFPRTPIRLIVGIAQVGTCQKTNSLCELAREARHELLVLNDSDVRVEKDYLRRVVAPFRDPQVGVVTALYRSKTDGSFAANADAVGIPGDAAARTIVAWWLGRMDFALGWTAAIKKQQLTEIGGFEALRNMHSDDFALGNEVVKRGYRVELINEPVWMVFPRESVGEFLRHELRWSIQLKNLRPLGYLGILLTCGFFWAVLVPAVTRSVSIAVAYVAAYFILRLLVAWKIGVEGLGDPTIRRRPWIVFVRDALQLGVYVASLFSNAVEWRGTAYLVQGPSIQVRATEALQTFDARVQADLQYRRE